MFNQQNIRRILRKLGAGMTAAAVACTTLLSFALTEPDDRKIFFELDFASGLSDSENTGRLELDQRYGASLTDFDGGSVRIPSTIKEVGTAGTFRAPASLESKKYILSFDFYAGQKNVRWAFQGMDTNGKTFFYFAVGTNGAAGFVKNGSWGGDVTPGGNDYAAAAYKENTWHTVDMLVDPDAPKMYYYMDGVYLGESNAIPNSSNGIIKSFAIFTGKDYVKGGEADPENQGLYLDNICINYVDEQSFYAHATQKEGKIRLAFSETPVTSLENPEVFACDTGERIAVKEMTAKGKEVTLQTESDLEANHEYAVVLPENITSISGNSLTDRIIYFYGEPTSDCSIRTVKLTDIYGMHYGPLEKVPITIAGIEIVLSGDRVVDESSVLSGIALKAADGTACTLSNASVQNGKVSLLLDGFLKKRTDYIFTADGLTAGGDVLPNYQMRFSTTDEVIEGFFPVDIVLKNGMKPVSLSGMTGVSFYASTRFVNTTEEDFQALLAIAAYKNREGKLELMDISTREISIPSGVMTEVGPSKEEVVLSLPQDAEIVKAFVWKGAEHKGPAMGAAVLPEFSGDIFEGEFGIFQSGETEISLAAETDTQNSDVSLTVVKKNHVFDNRAVYADQLRADTNGKAGVRFYMKGDANSGDYTAELTDADGRAYSFDFTYINYDEFNTAAEGLDTAAEMAENEGINACKSILESSFSALGISRELYEKTESEQTAKLVWNKLQTMSLKDGGAEMGRTQMQQTFLIAAAANGMLDNIFDYVQELRLKDDKNYSWYTKEYVTENVQKAITARQTGELESEQEFYDNLTKSFVLSVVASPNGEGNLRQVLQAFADRIGISKDGKDNTYRALVGKQFDTYAELKAEYERLENVSGQNRPAGGSAGGGGRGSGSGLGSTAGMMHKEFDSTIAGEEAKATPILDDIFDDLAGFEWARQPIVSLAEKRIIIGREQKKFCPGELITREEFVALLIRAFAKDGNAAEISFTDTDKDAWYTDVLGKAVQAGIVQGYEDGSFGIGREISRQEMVVMLNRTAEYAGIILEAAENGVSFSDDGEIADYARDAIYTMKQAGIVSGISAVKFAPNDSANRAQAAKVIFGLLNF